MPLTRHFYLYDEVISALYYTTTKRVPDESLFWCQELLDSGYGGEAISTLFESWLFNTGPYCLQWLVNSWNTLRSDEISETDILLATYQLNSISQSQRDTSLWYILLYPLVNKNIPDRVTYKTPVKWDFNKENEIETYFIRAIYQGKAISAWWASLHINEERIWELIQWYIDNINIKYSTKYSICIDALKNYEQLLGYKSSQYDIIIRCLSITMLCLNKENRIKSFNNLPDTIDPRYYQDIIENNSIIGRKVHRKLSIPASALYGKCYRSTLKWSQNTLRLINDIENNLLGCPFWDDAIQEYGMEDNGKIIWNSDDAMEEFYDKYFPDDIPDEWSKADKSKSHGDGLLGPNDTIKIAKYSRTHFNKKNKLCWGKYKIINAYLEQLEISCDFIDNILTLYSDFSNTLSAEDLKKLVPVKLRYIT